MEHWKKILSKCRTCEKNKFSCILDGKPCEALNTCVIRREYDEFIKHGCNVSQEYDKLVKDGGIPLEGKEEKPNKYCPLTKVAVGSTLALCVKEDCAWWVRIKETLDTSQSHPACAVIELLDVLMRNKEAIDKIRITLESKTG